MKAVLVGVFLLFSSFAIAQQNRPIITSTKVYSEDGRLQMLIYYDPSCNCRTYTEYYADGSVYAKRRFVTEGKKEYIDGDDLTYYQDGTIKQYKFWKNAVPDGRTYFNYENGKLEHEEFYSAKYKSGTWKYFNRKGELIKELVYVPRKTPWNSKKAYVTANFYADGKLAFMEIYEAGKKVKSTGSLVVGRADVIDGKELFRLKCAACHAPDKDGYGPALSGVTKKRPESWLYLMIRNGMKLVEEGDPTAVALYNKWRRMKHPNNEKLSNQQIMAIIDYLKVIK